jgi:hypothetical protein
VWARRARIELDSKPVKLGVYVGERLSLRGTGKAAMIVMVANRTREIRPSGMTRGACGNVGDGKGYTGTYRGNAETAKPLPNAARAAFLSQRSGQHGC